ncbi:MAG: hypothetical protein N4A72_16850 [Bacteroidales bacterium]|jgi:hypothetical protein|nr:hypothetical protein [Bacteroidales bacterium]
MRAVITYIILLAFIQNIGAQDNNNKYNNVDEYVGTIKVSNRTSVKNLAKIITKKSEAEEDKVRAIFFWITHNIRYNTKIRSVEREYNNKNQIITEVMKTRVGVCQHYAELFNILCKESGIKSVVIEGYTKQNGKISKLGHAWNAVYINNKWLCIDATWAAGYYRGNKYYQTYREKYFLDKPDVFIDTHMPFDPIWQFSESPITAKTFDNNHNQIKPKTKFNYKTLIEEYLRGSNLNKLKSKYKRVYDNGITNSIIKRHIEYTAYNIATEEYNIAVGNFNKGVNINNSVVKILKSKNGRPDNEDLRLIINKLELAREHFIIASENLYDISVYSQDIYKTSRKMQREINRILKDTDKQIKQYKDYLR